MFPGVLALVGRSLRVDARSWSTHAARVGLVMGVYVSLCTVLWNSFLFGAPGLRFFYGIGYLNLTFASLLGFGFFSTSITEEKEEDTLGLMLMAGISSLGILIGKSGGRLFQALLLVAVQYPFTLLAVTMGGVTATQVSAMYAGLAGYVIFLSGFGLLCSTLAPRSRTASSAMTIGLAAYILIPALLLWSMRMLVGGPVGGQGLAPTGWLSVVNRIIEFSVFQQMGSILTTGFGESIWSWQAISNAVTGVICFGLSWGLFGIGSRQVTTESTSRGLVSRAKGRMPMFSPGRAWGNPFVWKDFYFVAGGFGMIPVRLAFCVGLFFLTTFQSRANWGGAGNWNMDVSFFQLFLSLAVSIDAGRVLSRSLQDEVQGQTLPSLMMLPRSQRQVIYAKFGGALLGCSPGLLVDLIISIGTTEGLHNFAWVLGAEDGVGICVTAYFVLIPNLAALLSLFMRWGAVAASVAVSIALHVIVVMSLQGGGPGQPMFFFVGLLICALSIACHVAIHYRLKSLASM
jgi:ABC-type transport system involved in multi-copper enzyme maturation permease subunit